MKSIDIETFSTKSVAPIKAILDILVDTDEPVELTENGKTVYTVAKGAVKKRNSDFVHDYPPEAKQDKSKRIPGTAKGQIWIAPDFDELPDDIARAFGVIN